MKQYQIYLFTKAQCGPCERLKSFLSTIPSSRRSILKLIDRSSDSELFDQFEVSLHPTMVVSHIDLECYLFEDDEFCTQCESIVEKVEGANNILATLDATISAYTYADEE